MEEPSGNGIPYEVWIWGKMGPMHSFGKLRCRPSHWGLPVKFPQPHLPYTQVLLWHLRWKNVKISFDYHVLFYFCICNSGTGSEGWDCAALLSLVSLFSDGFHPRQEWGLSSGETPFLGDQKLLICHGRWELWNVWSKGKGPEVLWIKPCPWHEIQPKCVSSSRMYFSL